MKKTVVVEAGQNIADIAMQEFGGIDALLNLCLDNDLELGAAVNPGTVLTVDSKHIIDEKTVDYYKTKQHKPAGGNDIVSVPPWILATCCWDDNGIWDDMAIWGCPDEDTEPEWILQQKIWNDSGIWKDTAIWHFKDSESNDNADNNINNNKWLLDAGKWNDVGKWQDKIKWTIN